MPNLGFSELIIVLLIIVVVFGSTKLPQLGDGLGRAIKNFKRSLELNPRSITVLFANPEDADPVIKRVFPIGWRRGEETVKFYKTDLTPFFIYRFDTNRYFYRIYRLDSREIISVTDRKR